MSPLPKHLSDLKKIRIAIPIDMNCISATTEEVFDFLGKNQGLTEEFIYNNTILGTKQLPVYSASYDPIGYLPIDTKKNGEPLKICDGEVIIIFRQGYAGKMYIPNEVPFFASEHTIPIRVKPEFRNKVNPYWFIKYYEPEVLHYVTGKADSGNFSELAFKKIPLKLPPKPWQDKCADYYKKMDNSLNHLEQAMDDLRIFT